MSDYLIFTDANGKRHLWRVPGKPTAKDILHLLGKIGGVFDTALVEGAKNKAEVKQVMAAKLTLPKVEGSIPPGSEN